jgi:hypothetical protein
MVHASYFHQMALLNRPLYKPESELRKIRAILQQKGRITAHITAALNMLFGDKVKSKTHWRCA